VCVGRLHGDRVAENLPGDEWDDLRLEESLPCLGDDESLAKQTQENSLDRQEFAKHADSGDSPVSPCRTRGPPSCLAGPNAAVSERTSRNYGRGILSDL
jgi:hypothetical protein